MVSSKFWYFFIHNHDERNMLSQAMQVLDRDIAAHVGVSEVFYGFIPYHGSQYGIEGYIRFFGEIDLYEISQILPNFEVTTFDYHNYKLLLQGYLSGCSIFTKSGIAWNEGDSINALNVLWHYSADSDLQMEDNQSEEEETRAQ